MALWYLTRATGAVTLVLLTITLALGVVDVRRWGSWTFPRFLVDGVHRTAALLALALLSVHVTTTLIDSFAPIRLADAFIPFVSAYRPLWLGLGALALDLVVALVVTSLARRRIGLRGWRAVHWLAYACWPVAFLHALGTGSDVRGGWLLWLALACAAVAAAAVLTRAGSRRALAAATAGVAVAVVALASWLPAGPLARGWARRSGTPHRLLGRTASTTARGARR